MYIFKYPSLISIFVTNKCNLRCKHCCFDAGESHQKEMTTTQIKQIIDEITDMGIVCLDFSGGEPFLREDIIELIEYAYRSGIKSISVATNTLSITDEQIKALKAIQEEYRLFYLRISLDGSTAQTHEWLRGAGTFDLTINKIKKLVDFGINIRESNFVVSKKNYDEVFSAARIAKDFGIKTLVVIPLIPVGRAEELMDYMINPMEWKELCIKKSQYENEVGIEIFADSPVSSTLKKENIGKNLPCMCGYQFVGISPTGNYTICPIVSEGDYTIYDMGISDFWNKSELIRKVRDIKNLKGECAICNFKELCRGGCRGLSKCFYGDFYMPDPMCWLRNESTVEG